MHIRFSQWVHLKCVALSTGTFLFIGFIYPFSHKSHFIFSPCLNLVIIELIKISFRKTIVIFRYMVNNPFYVRRIYRTFSVLCFHNIASYFICLGISPIIFYVTHLVNQSICNFFHITTICGINRNVFLHTLPKTPGEALMS